MMFLQTFLLQTVVLVFPQRGAAFSASEEQGCPPPCPVNRLARKAEAFVEGLDDAALDRTLEHALDRRLEEVKGIVETYAPAAQIVIGASLALHGGELETTLLFAQALREVGGPQLKRACEDLKQRWRDVSEALREETPSLRAMRSALYSMDLEAQDLRASYLAAKADFDGGLITKEELDATASDVKRDFEDLLKAAGRVEAAGAPLKKVMHALDVASIRGVVDGAWQAVLTCVATATSGHAANVGVGLSLGDDVARTVFKPVSKLAHFLLEPDDDPTAGGGVLFEAAGHALKGAARLGTVVAAFTNQELALLVSSCTLGARLLVDGASKGTPALRLPEDSDNVNVARVASVAAVAAAGVGIQVGVRGGPGAVLKNGFLASGANLPKSPFRLVLAPAFRLDRALKRYSPALKKK